MAQKGGQGERDTSRELSLWWTDGERDDIFWRTSQSGGRATTRAKKKTNTAYQWGDITFTDPIGKPLIDLLLIENKMGYTHRFKIVVSKKTGRQSIQQKQGGISVLEFVDKPQQSKPPILLRWWQKAEIERHHAGRKYSVIIFKRDRKEKCIMMDNNLFQKISNHERKWHSRKLGRILTIQLDNRCFCVVLFGSFLQWCRPVTIKKLLEKPMLIRRKR